MTASGEALAMLPGSGEMVIFDLEWTAWEGSLARNWSGHGEFREIIQIGAVLLDSSSFDLLAIFDRLVLPVRNPVLSDYIVKLSGLTNERMQAEGVGFKEALAEFLAFIGDRPLWCNGADAVVLRDNCALQGFPCPIETGRIGNLRPLLAGATGLSPSQLVSCELPALLGVKPAQDRQSHAGVGDAISIAIALAALRKRGVI